MPDVEIKLPEIGEGIDSGDVLQVLVREGDTIEKDQDIVELETDKATMGVPSPQAGRITKVHVKEGDTVPIGGTLISIASTTGEPPAAADPPPEDQQPAAERPAAESGPDEPPAAESVEQVGREQRRPAAAPDEPAAPADEPAQPPAAPQQPAASPTRSSRAAEPAEKSAPRSSAKPPAPAAPAESVDQVAAGPAIRRFAREVGVDLRQVTGTGQAGRITREDVLAVVRQAGQARSDGHSQRDQWGPIHVERLSKIRRTIASKMDQSWSTVPRVTNFDDADITELEDFRQDSKADYAAKGIKLTTLPFVIKAVAMALKSHPDLNATIDLEQGQVIYKQYVNVGIAVDSERGLVVPSLRGVDSRSIPDIARSLAELADKVRDSDFAVEDLQGSTFTISNLGAIGGTYSTPILNVPEVAILLIGRARKMPVVVDDDKVAVRLMMPLSLSYDHRLVDGATAARFLNETIGYLRAPSRLLLAP